MSLVTTFSSTAPLGDLICLPYAHLEKMELPKVRLWVLVPLHTWDSTCAPSRQLVPLLGLLCARNSGSMCRSVLSVMVLQGWRGSLIAAHLSLRSGLIRSGDEASSAVCYQERAPNCTSTRSLWEGCVEHAGSLGVPWPLAWLCLGHALQQGPRRVTPPPWELGSCWELRLHLNCHLHFPINTRLHN